MIAEKRRGQIAHSTNDHNRIIRVEQLLTDAELGESVSLDSALARPFKILVKKGLDVGKINHIFFRHSEHSYILGSLCYSKGDRLIFFPGIVGGKFAWDSEDVNRRDETTMDHLTLEPDGQSWHLTMVREGTKNPNWLSNRVPREIKPKLTYWFGMSVQRPTVFEKAFAKHIFEFKVPSDKAKWYLDNLVGAKRGSVFHTLSLPANDTLGNNEFLQFDFLIDRRPLGRFRKLPLHVSQVPTGPPALMEALENYDEVRFPIWRYDVKLGGFRGRIAILVSRHKGRLTESVIFGGFARDK